MGIRYLLDTNVVLDFMAKNLPEVSQNTVAKIIDDEINISLITKIELLSFSNVEQNVVEAEQRLNANVLRNLYGLQTNNLHGDERHKGEQIQV